MPRSRPAPVVGAAPLPASPPAYEPDPDLRDATLRLRYFSGRAAEELAHLYPLWPANAPGLPPLPPSVVAQALALGDAPAEPPPGRKKAVYTPGPQFHALLRTALYQDQTQLQVDTGGAPAWVRLLPGMTLGGRRYGPTLGVPLFVVGKCLGPAEDQQRRPFVGPGSAPLWRAWAEAGLPDPAGRAYATNVARFVPPREAGAKFPRAWAADGRYFLFQELLLARPAWLLALGADALKALLGPSATLAGYRGRTGELVLDLRRSPDEAETPATRHVVRVVACEHPAAVVRDEALHPLLRTGLTRLRREAAADLGGPGPAGPAPAPAPPPDFKAIYTLRELADEVDRSIRASASGGYLALDCEWHGRHPVEPGAFLYTVQWSHAPGHGRCVFLKRCGGADNPDLPPEAAAEQLRRLFVQAPARRTRLVTHFGKGDLVWLKAFGVDLFPVYWQARDDDHPDGVDRLFGWQKTYREGPFDTYVAAHCVDESQVLQVEILCATVLGCERWDLDKNQETQRVAKEVLHCKPRALPGYGHHAEAVIAPYGMYDAMRTGELYLHFNGDPRAGTRGALDRDRFGLNSRPIFHLRMRSVPVIAEFEECGLQVDGERHRELREVLRDARDEHLAALRAEVGWPEWDPNKPRHRVALLYGDAYNDKAVRPPGALTLGLRPFKSTAATKSKLWDEAVLEHEAGRGPKPTPSTDKEAVAHGRREHPVVETFFKINTLTTALKNFLRPPDPPAPPPTPRRRRGGGDDAPAAELDTPTAEQAADAAEALAHLYDAMRAQGVPEPETPADAEESEEFSKGLMHYVTADGRVHSLFGWAETGRLRSSSYNLQNAASEGVDERYQYSTGRKDLPKARSIFTVAPGHLLLSADVKLAEVMVAAVQSGDALLEEHARNASLDPADPRYVDLHADLAVRSFKLDCPPTKAGLKALKKGHLRTAAKRTRFGHYYGASPGTLVRKIWEEPDAADVTEADVVELVKGHDAAYPALVGFFAAARARVASPGYLIGPYGNIRRFYPTTDRQRLGDQEREAQNATCQNPVADAVSLWAANVREERARRGLTFRMILSVHDSLMLEAPEAEAEEAYEVLETALTRQTPFIPCDFDGRPLPGAAPRYFGVDIGVGYRWEEWLEDDEWRAIARAARARRAGA